MSTTINVSVASFELRRYRILDDLLHHVTELVLHAKDAQSQVLVLPELVSTGLLWSNPRAGSIKNAQIGKFYREVLTSLYPAYLQGMSKIAVSNHIHIVGATFWHEEDGVGRNSAFVFQPSGGTIRQDKIHMTRGERAISTMGGNELTAFEISGVKCGLYTCYDVQFPELTRHLIEKRGVEVLFVPSLTDSRGKWRVYYSSHARAIENQCFVCVSTLVGNMEIPVDYPSRLEGQAFIACPIDNRFKIDDGNLGLSGTGVDLISVGLDIDLLRQSRSKSEIRQIIDRRDDVYANLS